MAINYRGISFAGYNKPKRARTSSKKFAVLAKSGNTVKLIRYGDANMTIKKNNPARQKSFLARHGATLKRMRAKGSQVNLQPVFWAIKSWRKGFNV